MLGQRLSFVIEYAVHFRLDQNRRHTCSSTLVDPHVCARMLSEYLDKLYPD